MSRKRQSSWKNAACRPGCRNDGQHFGKRSRTWRSPSIYGSGWNKKARKAPYRDDNSRDNTTCLLVLARMWYVREPCIILQRAMISSTSYAEARTRLTLETSGWLSQGSQHFRNPTAETYPRTEERTARNSQSEFGNWNWKKQLRIFLNKFSSREYLQLPLLSNFQYYFLTHKS